MSTVVRVKGHVERLSLLSLSNSFGLGRSLIAFGLFVVMAFDDAKVLFAPDDVRFPYGRCVSGSPLNYSLFCIFDVELGRWIALTLFLVVILGLVPAVTALPFAYAAWSVQANLAIPEGGDQLASNLAIIMLPISLLDWRLSQWSPSHSRLSLRLPSFSFSRWFRAFSLLLLWIQVAVVYCFAAIEKLRVEAWRDGTALYYWITDPIFGAVGLRLEVARAFTDHAAFVVLLTWGTLALEFCLAFAWMSSGMLRRGLFASGVYFTWELLFSWVL